MKQLDDSKRLVIFVLHLGKMTAIMMLVLMTLVTNGINTVNRVKSYTDSGFYYLDL